MARLVLIGIALGVALTLASALTDVRQIRADGKYIPEGTTVTERGGPASYILQASSRSGSQTDKAAGMSYMLEFSEFEDQRLVGPVAPLLFLTDVALWSFVGFALAASAAGVMKGLRGGFREDFETSSVGRVGDA